jgi:hypothetical protein
VGPILHLNAFPSLGYNVRIIFQWITILYGDCCKKTRKSQYTLNTKAHLIEDTVYTVCQSSIVTLFKVMFYVIIKVNIYKHLVTTFLWDEIMNLFCLYIIIYDTPSSACDIYTHYIHCVVVQDFVSGRVCCVNQYHYELWCG